jgi:hypothetical protein
MKLVTDGMVFEYNEDFEGVILMYHRDYPEVVFNLEWKELMNFVKEIYGLSLAYNK